ncbi:MAG: histidine kinase [Rubritepida sp.]|nr:histidine kinase [Rubritepida sp.]
MRSEGPASAAREIQRLRMFSHIAQSIAGDVELGELVQIVTDAATHWSGGKFGAFLYNVVDASGEAYSLYTLSGVPRSAFENVPMPRNTEIFALTFAGAGILRADDIRQDPRFGRNEPYFGMPKGHLPVVSYLAVPVVSRTGEVLGGLFLAHDEPGIFDEEAEQTVVAIAAHAAIAIDNARLLEAASRGTEATRQVQEANAWLAAIVESTDDAVLSKSLQGIISSWNASAERLFGFTAAEAIGRPVTILIPDDRLHEEEEIIGRIRQGQRVDHYETVRRRKDGALLDISLTVSPVRNAQGVIIGASKIARDISERKRAQQRQSLLLREMNHRVKNLFSVTTGLISVSALSARSAEELAGSLRERVLALSRAHDLTLPDLGGPDPGGDMTGERGTTLFALLAAIIAPHDNPDAPRMEITGADVPLSGATLTSLALLLHEFTTNAAKYGALSTEAGRLAVQAAIEGEMLALTWREIGGPKVVAQDVPEGFGSLLERATVQGLGGEIGRDWAPGGVVIRLRIPLAHLTG